MLIRGKHALSPAAKMQLMLSLPDQLTGEARVVALCSAEVVRKTERKLPSRDSGLGISVTACELLKSEAISKHFSGVTAKPEIPRIVQGLYEMLVVIVGSSEIILADAGAGENAKQHAAFIRQAAVRGGGLLAQLSLHTR